MTMYDNDRVVTLLRDIDVPAAPPDRLGQVSRRARAHETRRSSLVAGSMALVLVAGIVGAVSLHGRSNEQVLTVADAARTTQQAGSARLTLRLAIIRSTQAGLPVGDLMTLSGPVDFRHQRYVLKGTFGHAPFEVRGIGKDEWTKADLTGSFAAIAGVGRPLTPWTHSLRKASTSPLETVDPTELLEVLTKQGTTLSTSSSGDHTITVLRLPEKALGSTVGGAAAKDVDVTVESDADGRIRLLSYDSVAAGIGTRASLAYDDFGIDVNVSPPPADQVQESPAVTGGGVQTQTIPLTSSPADRQRACEAIRALIKQQPAPTDEQQKQAYARFKEIEQQACSPG